MTMFLLHIRSFSSVNHYHLHCTLHRPVLGFAFFLTILNTAFTQHFVETVFMRTAYFIQLDINVLAIVFAGNVMLSNLNGEIVLSQSVDF